MDFPAIPAPNSAAAAATRRRYDTLTRPVGVSGRLEDLMIWVSSCQTSCPPKQFNQARIIVFAGDHDGAHNTTPARLCEETTQTVATIASGSATINALAQHSHAGIRIVNSAGTDVVSSVVDSVIDNAIDNTEDNQTTILTALQAGRDIADNEVDNGADILIAGDVGTGNATAATTIVAILTDTEPVVAVGTDTGIGDAQWARTTAAVRDGMWRAQPHRHNPIDLLHTCGSTNIAAIAGFCAQAALRRTPVILDGLVVTAAALVAEQLAPGARLWWQAGHRSTEPAHRLALAHLNCEPILDLGMQLGDGGGAALALMLIRAAVDIPAATTFQENNTAADDEKEER